MIVVQKLKISFMERGKINWNYCRVRRAIISFIFLGAAILPLALASCSSDDLGDGGKMTYKAIQLSGAEAQVSTTVNDFSLKYAFEAFGLNSGNTLVAPYSMQISLSMLANGASGNTLSEILNVLGFNNRELKDVNAYNQKMWKSLGTSDPNTTLCIANGLWTRRFNADYAALIKEWYDGEVASASLKSKESTDTINDYFNQKTNGLVPKALDKLEVSSAWALVVNVLYFKSEWTHKFQKELTSKGSFNNADGSTSEVDMMGQTTNLQSCSNSAYTYVKLPFGNGAFSFDVILPTDRSLDESIALLKSYGLPSERDFKEYKTLIVLPKFEFQSKAEGKEVLKKMGVHDVFDTDRALLPLIYPGSVLNSIDQACKVKIDEEGGEASATTRGDLQYWSMSDAPKPEKVIRVDHPFIYMIRENSTGAILLMGKMVKM